MSGRALAGLLERDAECNALHAALAAARSGAGSMVLVEGEAGAGKTALLEHACDEAAASGMTVLRARGGELERDFAWGIVRQLFEPWRGGHDQEQWSALRGGSASLAETVFSRDTEAASTPAQIFSTLHGLYWMTVNLTREAPTLLAVDDLHWADRASLRYAVHLAPRLEGLPIVLLATLRPLSSPPTWNTDLLVRLITDSEARQLRPAPLSPDACTKLVRERLSPVADREFCLACHEMSGGNPFLLGALIDAWRAEGAEPTAPGAARVRRMTPSAVSGSVLVRLATLPDGCLALVRAVAILGARAEFRQAWRLAGLPQDLAVQAAGALNRAGILRGESMLEFVHPLVRTAVYGDLAPIERSRWHVRAAALQAADGARAEEVAPHLLASFPDGDQAVVARLREAAAQARARGAPDLAIDYLCRAMAEPPSPGTRADVLLELGSVEALQRRREAISHLQDALECAVSSQRRASAALALGDALAASGRLVEAIPVLDRGLAERDLPGDLRSHLLGALMATVRWEPSAQPRRHRAVKELQERAAKGESLPALLRAQLALETAAAGVDRATAIDHARHVLASAHELTLGASTVPEVALVLTFAALPEEAWRATACSLATARRLGWPLGVATSSTSAALTALHLGWISEALASARDAMAPGAESPFAPIAIAFLIEALIERGETASAHDELAKHELDGELALIWPTTPLLLARGRLQATTGNHLEAIEDLLEAGARVEMWGLSNPAITPWRSRAAVSLAAVGRRAEAVRLAGEELELARRWGTARAVGVALHAAGVAHGDDEGIELLFRAARTLQVARAPVEHARSLIDLGAALRRRGGRSQARDRLRHGLDLAHRHGALALADQARQELRVAGARPRRDALHGRDALTSSELRVARLAAEGRTNNEIAQLLFVTLRTVETHLTSSYLKLGIRSRRQLSGALNRQDLSHTGLRP